MGKKQELAKNTMILTIGKMCTQFISFLLLPLYTSILTPEEYGIVDLFTTYVSLILPIINWQMDQGIFRFMLDVRENDAEIKKLFTNVFLVNLLQSIFLIFVFFLFSSVISSKYKYYLLLNIILNIFSGLFMQFSRGLGKMFQYSISGFITALITIIFNIIFIAVMKFGAHGMFLATILGIFINCLYLFIALKIWKYIDLKKMDFQLIKDVCKYSLPMVPNQISGWVLSVSDRFIISKILGIAANGIYSISNKFSNLVVTFYSFFNMAWIETVSIHYEDEDRDEFISEMVDTILNIFVSVCIGIISIMPFVFELMINVNYAASYYQIPILLLSVIFQVLLGLYSAIYIALKKSKIIAKTTMAGALINIVAHLILIKYIGLYAASISTLIAYAVVALYRQIDLKKFVMIKFNKLNLSINILMSILALLAYYYNHQITNIISLIIVVLYAIVINRKFICLIIKEVRKKVMVYYGN